MVDGKFSSPFRVPLGNMEIGQAEKNNVMAAMSSGVLSYGPATQKFEAWLAKLHNRPRGVFMASGTCALTIALDVCRGTDSQFVIVPAATFIANVATVVQAGFTPVYCDIDPETYCMRADHLAMLVESYASDLAAVVPVHLLGRACEAIRQVNVPANVTIIEDCCEALGVSYSDETTVGSVRRRNSFAAISTYACHHITTGVGGALLCETEDEDRIRSLMQHGRDPAYLSAADNDKSASAGGIESLVDGRYKFVEFGHSYRGSELLAAFGNAQTERWTEYKRRRIAVYNTIRDGVKDHAHVPEIGYGDIPLFMPLRVKGSARDMSLWLEKHGIETRPMMPLIGQPAVDSMRKSSMRDGKEWPVASDVLKRVLLIGCHPMMTDEDCDFVVETVRAYR